MTRLSRPSSACAQCPARSDGSTIVGRAGGGRSYNTITLCPPLVITRAECDLVDTLDRALGTPDLG